MEGNKMCIKCGKLVNCEFKKEPKMTKHTSGKWYWGEGWETVDKVGTVYSNDGENPDIEKYMDLQLYDENGKEIIPIRIDHFEVIYDGDPIPKEVRNLITAAPDLLEACELAISSIQATEINRKTRFIIEQAISKARKE
jgi:hypothetical protein